MTAIERAAITVVVSSGLCGVLAWAAFVLSDGDRLYVGGAAAFTACALADAIILWPWRRS